MLKRMKSVKKKEESQEVLLEKAAYRASVFIETQTNLIALHY